LPVREIQNLALIGFMGSGKSAVGRCVAQMLGFEFLDTDQLIETQAGKSISEIFAQDGEPAFRGWERRVVEGLVGRKAFVISTGGGLPANPENLAGLKATALVICLWASPETLLRRVQGHTHRPLLNDPDPEKKIRDLLALREPFYRQADVLINTELRSVREVAQHVVHEFHRAREHRP